MRSRGRSRISGPCAKAPACCPSAAWPAALPAIPADVAAAPALPALLLLGPPSMLGRYCTPIVDADEGVVGFVLLRSDDSEADAAGARGLPIAPPCMDDEDDDDDAVAVAGDMLEARRI